MDLIDGRWLDITSLIPNDLYGTISFRGTNRLEMNYQLGDDRRVIIFMLFLQGI